MGKCCVQPVPMAMCAFAHFKRKSLPWCTKYTSVSRSLLMPDDKGVYRRVIHAHTTTISAMQVCSVNDADASFRVYTAAVDRSVKVLLASTCME